MSASSVWKNRDRRYGIPCSSKRVIHSLRAMKSGDVSIIESEFSNATQNFNKINEELRAIQKEGDEDVSGFV